MWKSSVGILVYLLFDKKLKKETEGHGKDIRAQDAA